MEENKGAVCPGNGLCGEVIRLNEKMQHMEEQQKKTDSKVESLEEGYKQVLEFQGGTKVYVAEIKDQITHLETRLFVFMGDLVKSLTTKDEKSETTAATERKESTKNWFDFAKFILGGTIFLVVAYLFGGGLK